MIFYFVLISKMSFFLMLTLQHWIKGTIIYHWLKKFPLVEEEVSWWNRKRWWWKSWYCSPWSRPQDLAQSPCVDLLQSLVIPLPNLGLMEFLDLLTTTMATTEASSNHQREISWPLSSDSGKISFLRTPVLWMYYGCLFLLFRILPSSFLQC